MWCHEDPADGPRGRSPQRPPAVTIAQWMLVSAVDDAGSVDAYAGVHAREGTIDSARTRAAAVSSGAEGAGVSTSDIIVVLVLTLLVASVAAALIYARHVMRGSDRQPGMATGDDPIWSRATGDDPTWDWVTADDPIWSRASGDT